MLEQEWITQEEYDEAVAQEMVFKEGIAPEDRLGTCTVAECGYRDTVSTFPVVEGKTYCPQCGAQVKLTSNESQTVYSYYVDTVVEEVARALAEKDGITEWTDSVKALYTDRVESGGYYIFCCYDESVQKAVDKIYKDLSQIPKGRSGQQLQSAMAIVDVRTGDVVAMAGGVGDDKVHDGYNRAEVPLQSGSSIKPLSIYAPAFESGLLSPASVIYDLPLNYNPGYGWPKNDNHKYLYTRTIFTGVRQSANAIAANTLKQIGLSYAFDFAKNKFGLSTLVESYNNNGTEMSDIDYAPLAMGAQTKGVTVREMAAAYATFANDGVYRESRTFTKVYDRDGNIVIDNTQDSREILSEKAVNYMNYCLQYAVSNGTGGEAAIYGQTVYGKTGTTSNNKDRWF
jgi:penicillin-binding protein 1A